jgi:hypothetical protein
MPRADRKCVQKFLEKISWTVLRRQRRRRKDNVRIGLTGIVYRAEIWIEMV